MLPIRAFHVAPPAVMIVKRDMRRRRREYDRPGHEILRRRIGKLRRRGRALGDCHITTGLDERCKLVVRDLGSIHPEAIDVDAMNRSRVEHGVVTAMRQLAWVDAADREFTARNPHHAGRGRARWLRIVGDRRRESSFAICASLWLR